MTLPIVAKEAMPDLRLWALVLSPCSELLLSKDTCLANGAMVLQVIFGWINERDVISFLAKFVDVVGL